ncbi:MAG: VPLPA-CTERM sorting domain-containing protein [Pseudomonadota bacterium]
MKKSGLYGAVFTIICSLISMSSHAATVTVEGTELPTLIPVDTQLAVSHGVVFSSNLLYVTFGCMFCGGNEERIGIYGTDPSGRSFESFATFNAPINVRFVSPVDGTTPALVDGTISAVWGDGGGDTDFLRMRAFDINGNLINSAFSSGAIWQSISLDGQGIHSVIFDQQPGSSFSSDTFLDSLTFNTPVAVPIPAAAWLVCSGLLSLLGVARRKTA